MPHSSPISTSTAARLESACQDMREMIQENGAWGPCVAQSRFFPSVSIQGEVLTAADRGAARRQRLEVKKVLSALASAQEALGLFEKNQ